MNEDTQRSALRELRSLLAQKAHFEVHPVDIEDARQRYTEEGFEFTTELQKFVETYGELTVTWTYSHGETEFTTSTERTMDAAHSTPRSARIYGQRIGQPVLIVGTAFSTEEAVLLAGNGEIFLAGDAGIQRVAKGFENAVQALVTGEWDKTFF
ncbi:SUKH-3 domain-containing protein [Streptomyces sp. NPDC048248]|uniref:SUKH-3 domain-containing protein n=1 Tax=Streptomyces sp. NPDC048248 TaxID=3365523 RepID=UPI0037247D3C